jgi:hypothetical protein
MATEVKFSSRIDLAMLWQTGVPHAARLYCLPQMGLQYEAQNEGAVIDLNIMYSFRVTK